MNYQMQIEIKPRRKYSTNTNSSEKPKNGQIITVENFSEKLELNQKKTMPKKKLLENNEFNDPENFFEMDLEEENLIKTYLKLLTKKINQNSFGEKMKKKNKNKMKTSFIKKKQYQISILEEKSNIFFINKSDIKNSFIYNVLEIENSQNISNDILQKNKNIDKSSFIDNLLTKKSQFFFNNFSNPDSFFSQQNLKKNKEFTRLR